MNNIAETICKMIESLPESIQSSVLDEINVIIAEKQDEIQWNIQFKRTQENLMAMARKVKKEISEGKTEPMDYEKI